MHSINKSYNLLIKTMPITHLVIPSVESRYSTAYIANVFHKLNIGRVSSVTLNMYSHKYNTAHITIDEWYDTETAYSIIKRLKDETKETRLVHNSNDEWWIIRIDK
jgi:hypothetical protein